MNYFTQLLNNTKPQISNKLTLWQGFNILDGPIDTIVIYEKDVLKVVMQIPQEHLDKIWIQVGTKTLDVYTSRSDIKKDPGMTECCKTELKRSLQFPSPVMPLYAVWDDQDNIISLSVPWLKEDNPLASSLLKGAGDIMTMDVRRRCVEGGFNNGHSPKSESSSPPVSPPKPVKRSFDVAFLMAPDDTNKRRHQEELKEQLRLVSNTSLLQRYSEDKKYPEVPLGLIMPKTDDFAKSAFTKVSRMEMMSPVSPELNYQDSMSPPIERSPQYYNKQYFPPKTNTPPYMYQPSISREKTPRGSPEEFQFKEEKGSSSKRYPELPYGGLTMSYPFPGTFTTSPSLLTAAANVSSLLPPSLAALTLPAQNVCAKCNISFRMTSDLVYHMRSQHKSDNAMADNQRRRREQDKLRCPVCNESFRERHHLTRHMTAHQDKDGDKIDDEDDPGKRRSHK